MQPRPLDDVSQDVPLNDHATTIKTIRSALGISDETNISDHIANQHCFKIFETLSGLLKNNECNALKYLVRHIRNDTSLKKLAHMLPFCAARAGNSDILNLLNEQNFDLSAPRSEGANEGWTLATDAASNGHINILQFLTALGTDLSAPIAYGPSIGVTPACCAAINNKLQVLRFLHSQQVNLAAPLLDGQEKGITPAIIAAQEGYTEMLQFLINIGVDPKATYTTDGRYKGKNLPVIAAAKGHVEILKVLKKAHVDLTMLTQEPIAGFNAVFSASANNQLEVLRFFHSQQVDLTAPVLDGPEKGNTPAIIAAMRGYTEMLQFLFDIGVDPKATFTTDGQYKGKNLPYVAAATGNVEILKVLKKAQVDLNMVTLGPRAGLTPAFKAAYMGRIEVIKFLAENGVDLAAPMTTGNHVGYTPAIIAAIKGNIQLLTALKELGIALDIPFDLKNEHNLTNQYIAASKGHKECYTYLGLEEDLYTEILEKYKFTFSPNSSAPDKCDALKALHLACLTGAVDLVANLVNFARTKYADDINSYKLFLNATARDCNDADWNAIHFIMAGTVDITQKVALTQCLIDNDYSRSDALNTILDYQHETGILDFYYALLSDEEKIVYQALIKKDFLKDIVNGSIKIPKELQLIRKENGFEKTIHSNEIIEEILLVIGSLVSKDELITEEKQKIHALMIDALKSIKRTRSFEIIHSTPISEDESATLCNLLQDLSKASIILFNQLSEQIKIVTDIEYTLQLANTSSTTVKRSRPSRSESGESVKYLRVAD